MNDCIHLVFNCSAVNKTRPFMSCFCCVFAEGEPLRGNKVSCGISGLFIGPKSPAAAVMAADRPGPQRVCLLLHCYPSSISYPCPSIRTKPLRKAAPPLGKTFALGSHLARSHFLFPWSYNLSCISSMHAFCQVVSNILEVRGTKSYVFYFRCRNWDDGCKTYETIIVNFTTFENTLKHEAEVSQVGYFVMALVTLGKEFQCRKVWKLGCLWESVDPERGGGTSLHPDLPENPISYAPTWTSVSCL